jgi:hypothetical protein
MLQWLYTYVASFYSQYFSYFSRRMLQVCFFGCCICFIPMLQVFYLDVVYILYGFQVFFRYFCKYFGCMFQVFHLPLDVYCKCCIWMFQVDRVLHLPPSSPLTASPWCLHLLSSSAGHPNQRHRQALPAPFLLDAGGATGNGCHEWRGRALLSVLWFRYMGRQTLLLLRNSVVP